MALNVGADILRERIRVMSRLRERMIEDMRLAGLAAGTQANYVRAVAQLACHYNASPDRLNEEQVRRYLLDLVDVQRAARGTFQYKSSGIRFFYVQTLGTDWHLFAKKNFARRSRSACRDRSRTAIFSSWPPRRGVRSIAWLWR